LPLKTVVFVLRCKDNSIQMTCASFFATFFKKNSFFFWTFFLNVKKRLFLREYALF
jgi:hypothetical protein